MAARCTVDIFKASRIGGGIAPSTTIRLEEEIPEPDTDLTHSAFIAAVEKVFEDQATALETALHNALPGGTYDRLLGLMLKRRASHFLVTF